MLPGKLAGSPNDRLFLIGAHYDTMRTTLHGSDDNGSGVAAMLQVAKQLAKGMVCHVIISLSDQRTRDVPKRNIIITPDFSKLKKICCDRF